MLSPGFKPSLSPQQVKDYRKLYEKQPDQFNEQTLQALEQHAEHYKLPFAKSEQDHISGVKNIVGQAAAGFWEGLTTLKARVADDPKNDAEAIARNIGHLSGFVGFLPSSPLKWIGLHNTANAVKALKGTSVPMFVAGVAQKKATKIVKPIFEGALEKRAAATSVAGKFLQGNVASDIAGGAFHLGVASAVSSWQNGIDEMMSSFIHGAGAGAFFRTLGNGIKTGNEGADKTLRTVAASMFQGLPATVAGETTPIQIYQYLLGAYFGFNESPVSKRLGEAHIEKMKRQYNPETEQVGVEDPRQVPGWSKLDKATKDYIETNWAPELVSESLNKDIADKVLGEKEVKEREALAKAFEEKKLEPGAVNEGQKPSKNEITSELESADSDPQTIPERLTHNSKKFVEKFLFKEERTEDRAIEIAADLDAEWAGLITKGIKNNENPSGEMINYVEKKHGGLNQEAKDFWVGYGFRKLRDRPVQRFSLEEGNLKEMPLDSDWYSTDLAGNSKLLTHEPKQIEKVFNDAWKETYQGEKRPGFSYAILDNVVIQNFNKTGFRSIDIGKYPEILQRIENLNPGQLDRRLAEEFGNAFKTADSKGMYYYGGKGDSENLAFVKYHPSTPIVKKDINKSVKQIVQAIKSEIKGSNAKILQEKAYKKDRREFIDKYKDSVGKAKAEEIYDRSFISNALYDVGLNGLEGLGSFKQVLREGFINDATNFNKRAQIWFTNGHSSDPKAVTEISAKVKKGTSDIKDGLLKITIVEDTGVEKNHPIGTPNSKTYESGDGPIYARSDIITALNRQAGLPEEGGVNKSFIVSPNAKYGALLGKYMIHPVTPTMEAHMLKNNLHMIIPKSSAKQIGNRNFEVINGVRKDMTKKIGWDSQTNQPIFNNSNVFGLPIEHIKIVTSETTSKKTMDNKRFPKQMWTNFTKYGFFDAERSGFSSRDKFESEMQTRFDDMYESLVVGEIKGAPEQNALLEKLISNPKLHEESIPLIIKNLDKVGMSELLEAVKVPGNEVFANEAYRAIHRMNSNIIEEIRAEGELTNKEVNSLKSEMLDRGTVNERIVNLMPDSLAGFLHKFSRDYRMSVMRNYFLHRITRPEVGNSMSARIRPYEIGMYKEKIKGEKFSEMERLEREDNIFFLGDQFKKKMVDASALGNYKRMTLEELWATGKNDPGLQRFFNGLVMRVPMDSMSGAHKLKFAGFTGINDMGILMHGRSMKALGGADLDGDKTMIFFGGKRADGEGVGFKEEWMDMYDWAKNEYVEKSKNGIEIEADSKRAIDPVMDPEDYIGSEPLVKKTYGDKLTLSDKSIISNRKSNKILQYSPSMRKDVSEASSLGRANLGPSVVSAATIRSAYSALRSSGKPLILMNRIYNPRTQKEEFKEVFVTAKTDEVNMKSFRGLTRASIGLSSDPMNEAGLNFGARGDKLFLKQTNRLFDFKYKNGKKADVSANIRRKGLTNVMKDINAGLYGKDFKTNKRYQMHEIIDKLRGINKINPEDRNTFLARAASDVQRLDWSDKLFFRLDRKKLEQLYDNHKKFVEELKPLQDLLGRTSMSIPRNQIIDIIYKYELYKPEGVRKQLDRHTRFVNILDNVKDRDGKKLFTEEKKYYKESTESRRIAFNKILLQAEDYIINDLSDMASFKVIHELSRNLPDANVLKVSKDVDFLKKNSYLLAKNNKKTSEEQDFTPQELIELQKTGDQAQGEAQSTALTQAKIDNLIKGLKKTYSKEEADLLDAMMLGTLWRGKKEKIDRIGKTRTPKMEREVRQLRRDSEKTSLDKLGYASTAIPDSSVKRMLKEYQKLFDFTTTNKLDDKTAQDMLKNLKTEQIEDVYVNEETRQHIDDNAPFAGLKKGKLNKEESDTKNELLDHLDYYSNSVGIKINGLLRDIVGKDMNTMTLSDWQTMNRFFQMSRDGTWWSGILGKPTNEISKWYYMMFPKTVDLDVMRREIKLFKNRKPFKTKAGMITGNVHTPEGEMVRLQNTSNTTTQNATKLYEEESRLWEDKISPYRDSEDGLKLFHVAVRTREKGIPKQMQDRMRNGEMTREIYNAESKEYYDAFHKTIKEEGYAELQNKIYNITIGKEVFKLTGKEVVDKMNEVITDTYLRMRSLISGKLNKEDAQTYFEKNFKNLLDKNEKYGDFYVVDKFVEMMEKNMMEGKRFKFVEELGLDGVQLISHSQLKANASKNKEFQKMLDEKWAPEATNFYSQESFWAHMGGDRNAAIKRLVETAKNIDNDKSLTKEEKQERMEKAIWHTYQLTNDIVPDMDLVTKHDSVKQALDDIALKKANTPEILKNLFKNPRVGHQMKRTGHIPGWSIEPDIMPRYIKKVTDSLYKHSAQIKMRHDIGKFRKDFISKTGDEILADNWVNFYSMYTLESLGYPQQLPQKVLDNPGMKIRGTPFAWFNDTAVLNKVNKVRKFLGIGQKKFEGLKTETAEELSKVDFSTLTKWSNLEAKYQLATLLAHPKSSITNLYGGTIHTGISAGMENLRNARNWEYLRKNINQDWKGKEDIDKWVQSLGVVEDFILYEVGLSPEFKGQKWKSFTKDAMKVIRKDPSVKDSTLRSLAEKHQISNSLFNRAAWFMRAPERALRRDAFLAHYLQARKKFAGAIKRYDDPVLIKMGLEGVKSTQFLYSAPFRPAFARSAMGKVLTRFQLWAWNSVRFRGDIIREARLRGFKQGTPEFERFKRLALTDALMYGLSNIFMYSIFENGLPQPWGWMQDFADWAFGDENERSRAFYGTYPTALAPLQAITPPSGRPLIGAFKAMMDDDWAQLAGYTGWSMIPFGRVGYDIFGNPLKGGKGGLMENPYRIVEKISGIPYQQIPRQLQAHSEGTTLGPRMFTRKKKMVIKDEETS